jgi:hypothetical protein
MKRCKEIELKELIDSRQTSFKASIKDKMANAIASALAKHLSVGLPPGTTSSVMDEPKAALPPSVTVKDGGPPLFGG